MEQQNETPKQGIMDKAVLVSLNLKRFGTQRRVESAAAEIENENGAERGRVKVSKRLLDCQEIKAITALDGEIRQAVYKSTLPNLNAEGIYVLPVATVDTFDAMMEGYAGKRDTLVQTAAAVLPDRIREDADKLGQLADLGDYPTPDQFKAAYQMRYRYLSLSVPDALKGKSGVWDRELAKEQSDKIDLEAGIRRTLREGFWSLCGKMAERLDGKRENGKIKIFRNSLVDNMTEYLGRFSTMNLTDDTELAGLVADAMDMLDGVTADDLRNNEQLRDNCAAGFRDLAERCETLLKS